MIVASIFGSVTYVHAEATSPPTNSTILAEELVNLLHLEKSAESLKTNIQRTTTAIAGNTLTRMSPEIRERAEKQSNESLNIIFSAMSWDKMKPIYVSVYAETFSAGELQVMINFYKTETGQKWIEKQPHLQAAIMQKSMGVLGDIQSKIMESMKSLSPALPATSSTPSATHWP